MALKNYTTQIKVEKTISEIEEILAKHGAKKILKDYDGGGDIVAVSFMVDTPHGNMPIKLPMDARAVSQILKNEAQLPQRLRDDIDQARKVGWRIIKDWIDSQIALIETRMVKIEEVFLPYAFDMISNKTLFQKLEEKQFKGMLLENKQQEEEDV